MSTDATFESLRLRQRDQTSSAGDEAVACPLECTPPGSPAGSCSWTHGSVRLMSQTPYHPMSLAGPGPLWARGEGRGLVHLGLRSLPFLSWNFKGPTTLLPAHSAVHTSEQTWQTFARKGQMVDISSFATRQSLAHVVKAPEEDT